MHLGKNPPRLFALPNPEKFYEPPSHIAPSHIAIWDFHPSGSVVILASQPSLIPDTKLRAAFARHKKGRNPDWEARMLASYMYRKSEEGKFSYDKNIGEGKGIGEGPGILV